MTGSLPDPDRQEDVIDFLSQPGSYGLRNGPVERVETHCSIVFLAADRAYKLKRKIRFASLDYTTTALREAACRAEVVLNRRTAPDMYLGVRSINRHPDGTLAFDGNGPALDHVVVMRRFAQDDLFDRMADRGALTPALMHDLGLAIARLHLAAEITPRFGGSAAIRHVVAVNERELARVSDAMDGAAFDRLRQRISEALEQVAPLLDQRGTSGRVRRCHGDLRLANICLWCGHPTLFDCIEFSDETSCVDVLFDLAFLLMDLHLRSRNDYANAVFNAYLDLMPEGDGLVVLPLFMTVRAVTRSYALAGKAGRQSNPHKKALLLAMARQHINAGLEFLTSPEPSLMAVGGDTADGRAELAVPLATLVDPVPGARLLHLRAASDSVWNDVSVLLTAGCSVLVEGAFTGEAERREIVELASTHDVPFTGVWIGSPPDGLEPRHWHIVEAGHWASALASLALSLSSPPSRTDAPPVQ